MNLFVSRVDSFTSADLPAVPPPVPAGPLEPAPRSKAGQSGKLVKHLVVMKALASKARLTALELVLDGSAINATDIAVQLRLSARRVSQHLSILADAGLLVRRPGSDKRVSEYVVQPGFVRAAENGSAIFDFGSGELYFPRVKLPVSQSSQSEVNPSETRVS